MDQENTQVNLSAETEEFLMKITEETNKSHGEILDIFIAPYMIAHKIADNLRERDDELAQEIFQKYKDGLIVERPKRGRPPKKV